MLKQVTFINREEELALIDQLINEWDTRRIVGINAPGGIGKTRLLQEIHKRYTKDKSITIIVTNIVDFDDQKYHLPQNMGREIAQMLNEEIFEPYFKTLLDLRKMEMADVSIERLLPVEQEVYESFIACFNKVSDNQRVILLIDTLDALTKTPAEKAVLEYLMKYTIPLKNCIFLMAGREIKDALLPLKTQIGDDLSFLDLQPLPKSASETYLQKKQEQLSITLDADLTQKIVLLAKGKPILIDLAVEWLTRDIPLDWLIRNDLTALQSLSQVEKEKYQQEFEYQLVRHIATTRQTIDWLILMMVRIYPLEVEMVTELLDVSNDEAQTLFEEAKAYTFVKSLPDGRITLHDEMREMIDKYVWPEVDPDGDRRHQDSQLAAAYLQGKIQALTEEIERLQEKEKAARQAGNVEEEWKTLIEHDPLNI